MFQKIKSALPWAILFIVLAAVIAGLLWRGTGEKMPRRITTNGECIGHVERDKTAITITVRILDKDAGVAVARARGIMNSMTAAIKTIPDDTLELQTTRFDAYEKTEWNRALEKSVVLGIEASISLDVSSSNRDTIEQVLSKLPAFPEATPENLRIFTSVEKLKPAMEDCLEDAVKNARDKAEAMATAEGIKLGKMIFAEYAQGVSNPISPRPIAMKALAYDSAAMSGGGLQSSDTDFTVSVVAAFDIR